MLVGALPERQPLVDRDDPDAQPAGLLDELDAGLVVQVEAASVGSPLGIGLPGRDPMARSELVHAFEVPGLVGIHPPVDQQPMRSLQLLDDARGGLRLLDGERLALAGRRYEGKHHQVGVGVQEDVLHELVRPDAVQIVEVAGPGVRRATAAVRRELQRLGTRR